MHPSLRRLLCLSLALLLVLPACQADARVGQPEQPDRTPHATTPATWYTVYFTDPDHPRSESLRGGPDQALAKAIRSAQASVDMAVLQLDLWSIRDALLEARQKGVRVRLVTESEYLDEKEIQQLIEAGIPVVGDRREGLMHNKFTIIDGHEVWCGSMNYSISETYRNNNNLVRIRSSQLAQDYTAEFEEMFEQDQFGPGSPANTPAPVLNVQGTQVEVCFAPDDGCAQKLVDLINGAQKSIHFLAFSFTSDELGEAMRQQAAKGVRLAGVMEESQARSNNGTEFDAFRSAGLQVRLDGNAKNMHHKVIIIDGEIVVFGSYNFTFSAETRNDENLLMIHNQEIAALFQGEFQKIFDQAGLQ